MEEGLCGMAYGLQTEYIRYIYTLRRNWRASLVNIGPTLLMALVNSSQSSARRVKCLLIDHGQQNTSCSVLLTMVSHDLLRDIYSIGSSCV